MVASPMGPPRQFLELLRPRSLRGNRIPFEDKILVPGRLPRPGKREIDSRGRKPDAHVVSQKEGARAALER